MSLTSQNGRVGGIARLPAEVQVCLATAGGCLVVGGIGWALHLWTPATNNVRAVVWIGVFYLVLGIVSLVRAGWNRARRAAPRDVSAAVSSADERRVA